MGLSPISGIVVSRRPYIRLGSQVELPTSRASNAELGARKIYTMQAKTEREARNGGARGKGKSSSQANVDVLRAHHASLLNG